MMKTAVIATKRGMTQAWTTTGKRLAVTRCIVEPLRVISQHTLASEFGKPMAEDQNRSYFQVGFGSKKLKNTQKPLRAQLEKGGFSFGVKNIRGMQFPSEGETTTKVGDTVNLFDSLAVGDVVKVQGQTKGRGFSGAMKRHGFKGVGARTHGQSDRERAVGSIGSGTTPGRVLKGKRMPGHYGTEMQTVSGLVVIYVDPTSQEVWLNGPIPGANDSIITIHKTGDTKDIALDLEASGLKAPETAQSQETTETESTPQATPTQEETQPETATEATPQAEVTEEAKA